ncbi:MAG: FdhF/YdeP family oxidoreductase [Pirellulaceae bacterium]
MKAAKSGGGWKAIWYTLRLANRVGWRHLWSAMRAKNACKTCALGMGGQLGGMVNEGGYFPEVCKKSFQAMVSDMQSRIAPEFWQRYSISQLRSLTPRELELCGRLVDPVYAGRGDSHFRVITWDEAFQRLAERLHAAGPERSFFYASGRSSNEAGFLLQLLARQFGTNYVNNCSYYCHQASGVGLTSSIGTGTGTVRLEDVERADLYILIGANPASNHPRLMRSLMQIRRSGGHVLVINPVREVGLVQFRIPSDPRSLLFGTKIASLYVQPHIGGDLALLTGMAKIVLERQGEDRAFIQDRTEGFADFQRSVAQTSWESIEQDAGVDRATVERAAEMYLAARHVVFGWTMGITHHLCGVENVQMIANLALLRGMVGRLPAGLMPIRGHSNVQGVGSVGVTPQLKQTVLQRFEQRLGLSIPRAPGLDTMACMQAAFEHRMQAALCLGGNLYGSNPDAQFAAHALARIGTVAYLSTTLNTGHAWGTGAETLILPVLPRDEEPQPTTQESMFSFVRYSDGGPARYTGPRSEVAVLAELGRRVLTDRPAIDWNELANHRRVRQLIADLIPGMEPLAQIDETRREFSIAGRQLDGGPFPTESGKARFHALPFAVRPPLKPHEFRLMTVRTEGQFNTVVYEEEDIYRGQERRDVVLISPEDLTRQGWQSDQLVTVRSSAGVMRHLRVRPFDIRSGNALMYFPEANVLVPRHVDPQSKTPAFKSVLVTIEAEPSSQTLSPVALVQLQGGKVAALPQAP